MTRKPTPSAEARDLRTLVEAVTEALTLPYDTPDYDQRIVERARIARIALRDVLDTDADRIGWNADWLRSRLTTEQTEAAERGARQ
jgi:hypothetical protein